MKDRKTGFELKTISVSAVQRAIEKAEQYRRLNDPEQAESICRDVLAVDSKNQQNLVTLILAITDQFSGGGAHASKEEVQRYLDALESEYERAYYSGVVAERRARAYLVRNHARAFAYDDYREAMDWYEKASAIRPPGNDDALLRWNSCVRQIHRESLRPMSQEDPELPLE